MTKCNLCWCNTNSWKGLGCKLHSDEYHKRMPCGYNENLMAIMAEKHRAHANLRKLIEVIRKGEEIDSFGISGLAKKIGASLNEAEGKMLQFCLAYQEAIKCTQREYDKSHGKGGAQ